MELKDFIKVSLIQINDAIKEIKAENNELEISIAPRSTISPLGEIVKTFEELEFVEFDLAVNHSKKGKLNISVFSGGAEKETSSRIKFRVPVCFGLSQTNNSMQKEEIDVE
ncbi:MAG: hypothetical protein KAJ75_01535 [Alphaproteobacteria bacterium]|nr:hypothetical protein [Alphaproteobacteria bacterium]